jgi:hypothetical protein
MYVLYIHILYAFPLFYRPKKWKNQSKKDLSIFSFVVSTSKRERSFSDDQLEGLLLLAVTTAFCYLSSFFRLMTFGAAGIV